MSEILKAEIVAYSSPKEIFVNGLSWRFRGASQRRRIENSLTMNGKR
jgi:hypothetical protein